jgi:hypothetical protein
VDRAQEHTGTAGPVNANVLHQAGPPNSYEAQFSNFLIGLLIFLFIFVFSISYSSFFRDFYCDDNVVDMGPMIVEAARRLASGDIPFRSIYVGGGGGSPIIAQIKPGVLSPFVLLPALVFRDNPELMTNVIVSLHLAIFAAGGWFLACCFGVSRWAGFVSAFSLGFLGFNWLWGPNWMAMTNPYSFLPWLLGGLMKLADAQTFRQNLAYQVLTACVVYCLFVTGCPNPAFYGFFVLLFVLGPWIAGEPGRLQRLLKRLVLQFVFFGVVIFPLLFKSWEIYRFYGRLGSEEQWVQCSVPFQAYLGLLFPDTYSLWTLFRSVRWLLSNNLLFTGIVPAWWIAIFLIRKPRVVLQPMIGIQLAGILCFMVLMSPESFGLADFFSRTTLLNYFRYPMRALPAFQVALICLFLTMVRLVPTKITGPFLTLLPLLVLVFSIQMLNRELTAYTSRKSPTSWYRVVAEFKDQESWKISTLEVLRTSGFVLTLCRDAPPLVRQLYFDKPRLFFHGNLGAQYQVRTVGSYMMFQACKACQEAGMDYRGRFIDWPRAENLIKTSTAQPLAGPVEWASGIAPESVAELAEKTYIGAVIVEATWPEPLAFFRHSDDWRLLDENQWAAVFTRATIAKRP